MSVRTIFPGKLVNSIIFSLSTVESIKPTKAAVRHPRLKIRFRGPARRGREELIVSEYIAVSITRKTCSGAKRKAFSSHVDWNWIWKFTFIISRKNSNLTFLARYRFNLFLRSLHLNNLKIELDFHDFTLCRQRFLRPSAESWNVSFNYRKV